MPSRERVSRGPTPLLLTPKEVDALYDCMEVLHAALEACGIPYLLVAGSLLGAVRSQSILFCDDDVDIAVLEQDYPRLLELLPAALAPHATYVRRPWPAADKVRPRALPHVWIDVFVLRRYGSLQEVRQCVSVKDNGQPQPQEYVDAILGPIAASETFGAPRFPLWHYDSRKALELWPHEFFTERELFPLRPGYQFGHLTLPGPAHPLGPLRRAYGTDVFQVYKLASSHVPWCKEIRDRLQRTAVLPTGSDQRAGGEQQLEPQEVQQQHQQQQHQQQHQQRPDHPAEQQQQGQGQTSDQQGASSRPAVNALPPPFHPDASSQPDPSSQADTTFQPHPPSMLDPPSRPDATPQMDPTSQSQPPSTPAPPAQPDPTRQLISTSQTQPPNKPDPPSQPDPPCQQDNAASLPLAEEHFVPVQHSRRCKRVASTHCRKALASFLEASDKAWTAALQANVGATPPMAGHRGQQQGNGYDGSNTCDHTRGNTCDRAGGDATAAAINSMAAEAPSTSQSNSSRPKQGQHISRDSPRPPSPAPAKPSWFGAAVRRHTNDSPEPLVFTPDLLAVMEPHIAKARAQRAAALSSAAPLPLAFLPLTVEASGSYDPEAHPLGATLATALGLPEGSDLTQFHTLVPALGGKGAVMSRLRCAEHRAAFHAAFDAFVRSVVAPAVASALPQQRSDQGAAQYAGVGVLYFQSFPCVRVIQPNEFSLGPHCDAAYGHAAANLNIIVPLTPDAGAAALYMESAVGREDWHRVSGAPGSFTRFHGARCLHWTSENTTPLTRVSLDFRVVPGQFWNGQADSFCESPGYYACAVQGEGGQGAWQRVGDLPAPTRLMGYPFTMA